MLRSRATDWSGESREIQSNRSYRWSSVDDLDGAANRRSEETLGVCCSHPVAYMLNANHAAVQAAGVVCQQSCQASTKLINSRGLSISIQGSCFQDDRRSTLQKNTRGSCRDHQDREPSGRCVVTQVGSSVNNVVLAKLIYKPSIIKVEASKEYK